MTTIQLPQKLLSELVTGIVIDGSDRTTAAYIPVSEASAPSVWWDMQNFSSVIVYCLLAARTDNIEALQVFAASDSTNSLTDAVEVGDYADRDTDILDHDAAGDWVSVEVTAEQLAQEGADNSVACRYISAKVKLGNGSDRATIIIVGKTKQPRLDATKEYTA